MPAATGLSMATLATPMARATANAGSRNCQTETPAARTDDQLVAACQAGKAQQAAEQDRERHELLGQMGQVEERHVQRDGDGRVWLVGRPPHQLDRIDRQQQSRDTEEDDDEPDEELSAQVGRDGTGNLHVVGSYPLPREGAAPPLSVDANAVNTRAVWSVQEPTLPRRRRHGACATRERDATIECQAQPGLQADRLDTKPGGASR